jgi:hypothetical protein
MEHRDKPIEAPENGHDDEKAIADAIQQMESLYKSRCVKNPLGSNVVIREVPGNDDH